MNGAAKGDSLADVLVCFAVNEEAAAFRTLAGPNVRLLITGMGRRNTEQAIRKAFDSFKPILVLTCGFAGALDPELRIGEVIFSTADPALDRALANAGAKPARFLCASRVVTTSYEKAVLHQTTGMAAVEMESQAIHEICVERRIPACATVRVISDSAEEDLPLDFNSLMTANQKLSLLKLTGAVLKSPGTIPRLMQLQRNTKLASTRLAEVLVKLLSNKI